MVTYNLDRARSAVQYLVDSPYFHHHVVKLRTASKRPRAMPFKEDSEVLNELVAIGRQSLEALENLIEVAEAKRSDRNDYQRQYMAAKRRRERLAVELEEALEGRKLDLRERIEVLQRQYKVWNKEKSAHLARAGGAQLGWNERNAAIKQFWDAKDAELLALIAEAKQRGPIHKGAAAKRVVRVPRPEPTTALGRKLAGVLGGTRH